MKLMRNIRTVKTHICIGLCVIRIGLCAGWLNRGLGSLCVAGEIGTDRNEKPSDHFVSRQPEAGGNNIDKVFLW